jgi:SnoaL-like domain
MERSPAVERLVLGYVEALNKSDVDAWRTDDVTIRGDRCDRGIPAEYVHSYDEIVELMRNYTPESEAAIHSAIDDLRGYQRGSLGWWDATGHFEHDGVRCDVRWTGVAQLEGGQWKVIQAASVPVPFERHFDGSLRDTNAA